jgi:hypothetical protein
MPTIRNIYLLMDRSDLKSGNATEGILPWLTCLLQAHQKKSEADESLMLMTPLICKCSKRMNARASSHHEVFRHQNRQASVVYKCLKTLPVKNSNIFTSTNFTRWIKVRRRVVFMRGKKHEMSERACRFGLRTALECFVSFHQLQPLHVRSSRQKQDKWSHGRVAMPVRATKKILT